MSMDEHGGMPLSKAPQPQLNGLYPRGGMTLTTLSILERLVPSHLTGAVVVSPISSSYEMNIVTLQL